jgi:hypothetical protein
MKTDINNIPSLSKFLRAVIAPERPKCCRVCGGELDKNYKDRHCGYLCFICYQEWNLLRIKEYRRKNPDKCKEYQERSELNHPGAAAAAVRRYMLTPEGKAKIAAYQSTDEFKVMQKVNQARYHKTDKGKAALERHNAKRRAAIDILSTLTADEWEAIQKQYKYKCVYCGEIKPLTKDHIIPLSKGGNHVKENILPACRSCNSKKNNKPVLQQLLAMA